MTNNNLNPPSTPSKRNGSDALIRSRIHNLNASYNLGLSLPREDENLLSPSQQRSLNKSEEEIRHDTIFRRLRIHHHKGSLDEILRDFDDAARLAWQGWVPKPLADPDTLPSGSTRNPPRAFTAEQTVHLQHVLMSVLDNRDPRRRVFGRTQSGPSRLPNQGFSPPKRQSSEGLEDPFSKRVKACETSNIFQRPSAKIDDVPIVSRNDILGSKENNGDGPALESQLARIPVQSPKDTTTSFNSVYASKSANTSYASLVPSVFSVPDDRLPDTQTTIESSTQEKKSYIGYHHPASSDSFPISSEEGAILNASFNDPHLRTGPGPDVRLYEDTYDDYGLGGKPEFIELNRVQANVGLSRPNISVNELDGPSESPGPLKSIQYPELPQLDDGAQSARTDAFEDRLNCVWPPLPPWLRPAPLPIRWEITRIALHCGVSLDDVEFQYSPGWTDLKELRKCLWMHPMFSGKAFPESPRDDIWTACFSNYTCRGHDVVLTASMDLNTAKSGPLYHVRLNAPKLDKPHRLSRRFGPDRFMELLFPSPDPPKLPAHLKGHKDRTIQWLTRETHSLAGCHWSSFYTKDSGYKKPQSQLNFGPDPKPVFKDRVYFFAEDGVDFMASETDDSRPLTEQRTRTRIKRYEMLDWAFNFSDNVDQQYLKLFQRIPLLLSRIMPTIVFEPSQIIYRNEDLKSPTGEVMNDGIGLMSRSVARKVSRLLGLDRATCAIQARIAGFKGVWLLDVNDTGDEDWIICFPSQKKWNCNLEDREHRTLGVRNVAGKLRPASLNIQFLPILEDRARDKKLMRGTIGNLVQTKLQEDLDSYKVALNSPPLFRQWVAENSPRLRKDRLLHGQVPYLAGLPNEEEETLNLLLDGGFDPAKQKYASDIAWNLQAAKCEMLKKKLNVKIARSANILMVVDFWGILKEDEIHLGFSSEFRDGDDYSETLLDGIDVLVARSPAHFPSDIHKMKAVFKSELRELKDVIVFPSTGNFPIADILSGGDYDGDTSWTCWEPSIVDNFVNAPSAPARPDLRSLGYWRQRKETYKQLVQTHGKTGAMPVMVEESFAFNMKSNMLGICTNFKERLGYQNNCVSDEACITLSTLLSDLVDQPKQGIEFTDQDWFRFRNQELKISGELGEPAYKRDVWTGDPPTAHIIDYLKFGIAIPAINRELAAFNIAMNPGKGKKKMLPPQAAGAGPGVAEEVKQAHYWDKDLAVFYDDFHEKSKTSRSMKAQFESLKKDIATCFEQWKRLVASLSNREATVKDGDTFPQRVTAVYETWKAIQPHDSKVSSRVLAGLVQEYLPDPELSQWALLRASVAFKLYYTPKPTFVWRMAGRQLCFIKAMMSRSGSGGVPVFVVPSMYAALKPDGKYVRLMAARMEGEQGSEYDKDVEEVGVEDDP